MEIRPILADQIINCLDVDDWQYLNNGEFLNGEISVQGNLVRFLSHDNYELWLKTLKQHYYIMPTKAERVFAVYEVKFQFEECNITITNTEAEEFNEYVTRKPLELGGYNRKAIEWYQIYYDWYYDRFNAPQVIDKELIVNTCGFKKLFGNFYTFEGNLFYFTDNNLSCICTMSTDAIAFTLVNRLNSIDNLRARFDENGLTVEYLLEFKDSTRLTNSDIEEVLESFMNERMYGDYDLITLRDACYMIDALKNANMWFE